MNQLKIFQPHRFCNGDLNKFFLLLRKGIYPYEYIDTWERFDENTMPPKEAFYSELNLENITDKDYEHVIKKYGKHLKASCFVCSMRYIFAF